MDWKTFHDFEAVLRLPFCLWENRKDLPKLPGIYFLTIEDELLVYVGQAGKSIQRRWKNHHLNGRIRLIMSHKDCYGWHQPLIRVHYQLIHQDGLRASEELMYIRRFNPNWNTQLVIKKDYGWSIGRIVQHYSTRQR